ncbi:MAG: hypothetical protein AB8H86_01115 [Polyangiales bacterium]
MRHSACFRRSLLVFALLLCWALPLSAQEHRTEPAAGLDAPPVSATMLDADEPSLVSVEILAGTTLPFDVSLGARLVLAQRFFAETSVGRSAYGSLAGSVALSLGGDEVATLIEPAFSNAWMFRFGFGVRPFGQGGPELSAGYARLSSAATWSAADLSLPASAGELAADITLHMLYVELGWSIDVFGPLFLRPAIGWSQVLDANTRLSSSANLSGQAAAAMATAETSAEAIIEQYGKTPTLSLAIGARF